ncbi:Hypothetical protein GbCGDNIH2_0378 [Granulibacter bethesdensis]|uniref:Uncharacterized protein n=1 Tax=Granulibacter bethesdensis (strain ATCC BAA-1260 / CGDNIH1) TaxID=391165 RepID=Q0BV76_GRABC|nr:Hypothetical protein GbCGDNIH1_0378 [Granulibacter bethesdensis CGDNIH1]AHJ67387.1 Hypothetical protein GbCGDNIH2_0378 [Granulibacter bethesdensis]APH51062.1 Hypothetical protein GbCGDNIH5_0378 [Granulibacter bethesdensis]APH63756.1 Hypothetical protein GbCGDNIH1I4_0378 [Granulibacter bethesdensis]
MGIKERKAGHKAVSCTAFLPEAGRGGLSIGRDTQALADRGGNVQLRSGQDWRRKAARGQTQGQTRGQAKGQTGMRCDVMIPLRVARSGKLF